ncbi:MAG: HEAT repeat domain-containing protein [Desulfobacterales bacterium]
MEKQSLLNLFINPSSEDSQIDAARRLDKYICDKGVLHILCTIAVEAVSDKLREAVIKTLKLRAEEANRWFKNCAVHSPIPAERRRALIALSLMECQTAQDAIIGGLQDSHRSVRVGAALNAGLYYDKEVLKALENYFEKNPLDFALESFVATIKKARIKEKGIGSFAYGTQKDNGNLTEDALLTPNRLGEKPSVTVVCKSH